jgi:hypothetical protein
MVALVDDLDQVILAAPYAETLTDKDWQNVGGNAVKLNAAGSLISSAEQEKTIKCGPIRPFGKSGRKKLTDSAKLAQSAVKNKDRPALLKTGNVIVTACEGCHNTFKVDPHTGGLYHIPVGNEPNGRR